MSPRETPPQRPGLLHTLRRALLLAGALHCIPAAAHAWPAGAATLPSASSPQPSAQDTAAAVHNTRAAFLRSLSHHLHAHYSRLAWRVRTLGQHCPAGAPPTEAPAHASAWQPMRHALALHCQATQLAWQHGSSPVCWRVDAGSPVAHLGWQTRQALRLEWHAHARNAVQRLDAYRQKSVHKTALLAHALVQAARPKDTEDMPERAQAWADLMPPRLDLPGLFALSPRYQLARTHIQQAAGITGVDPHLLEAVTVVESRFNPRALSPKGAIGLMQLMPATAQRFGVRSNESESLQERLTDPATNVLAGARYLRYLMQRFPDRLDLVLAGYNAGEGAVRRYGHSIPPYRETQHYVRAVMATYEALRARDRPGDAQPTPALEDLSAPV